MGTSQPFGFLAQEIVVILGALGVAFYSSWKLTLVILATFPVSVILMGLIGKNLGAKVEAQKLHLAQASKFASTAISAVDTVKVFNGHDQEVWQYSVAIKEASKWYLQQARINAFQVGIVRFAVIAMFVQGFWYGITLVSQGHSPGNVLATFFACLQATQGAEALLPQLLILTKAMSAGETLHSLLPSKQSGRKLKKTARPLNPSTCCGDIEVNNVSFCMSPSRSHVADLLRLHSHILQVQIS